MPDTIEITPCDRPIYAVVRPPGSKSITNRALVCAALAEGQSLLSGALDSEDTRVMVEGLRQLGVAIELRDNGETIGVHGVGGSFSATEANIFVGNSGTTIRFLTAAAAFCRGKTRLDGVARMRERPIGDLVKALNQLGCNVACELGNDCPPVVVNGSGLAGGAASVRGDVSSQFLSGLLMAAPYADSDVVIDVEGSLVSMPYVEMTCRIMESFGASVALDGPDSPIHVNVAHRYQGRTFQIEPDASAASYFLAAAAVTGGEATIGGLGRNSLQGDVGFCYLLEQMGCTVQVDSDSVTVRGGALHGIDVDMNAISDTAQTLAVVAIFARGSTHIRNVGHMRKKETDRIAATATELRKLGAHVDETKDGLTIHPGAQRAATIDTYDDHRMAMSFAIAGLRIKGVKIRDPDCTVKTYPGFFDDLNAAVAS